MRQATSSGACRRAATPSVPEPCGRVQGRSAPGSREAPCDRNGCISRLAHDGVPADLESAGGFTPFACRPPAPSPSRRIRARRHIFGSRRPEVITERRRVDTSYGMRRHGLRWCRCYGVFPALQASCSCTRRRECADSRRCSRSTRQVTPTAPPLRPSIDAPYDRASWLRSTGQLEVHEDPRESTRRRRRPHRVSTSGPIACRQVYGFAMTTSSRTAGLGHLDPSLPARSAPDYPFRAWRRHRSTGFAMICGDDLHRLAERSCAGRRCTPPARLLVFDVTVAALVAARTARPASSRRGSSSRARSRRPVQVRLVRAHRVRARQGLVKLVFRHADPSVSTVTLLR